METGRGGEERGRKALSVGKRQVGRCCAGYHRNWKVEAQGCLGGGRSPPQAVVLLFGRG